METMPADWLDFIVRYGLPTVFVILLVFEVVVPRGRLRREEGRGDKAMDIAEAQVQATRDLTAAISALDRSVQTSISMERDRAQQDRSR